MSYRSKGSGAFRRHDLGACGDTTILEDGVRVFHAANVHLGNGVYVGHNTILEGYHERRLVVGDGSWIGAGCFFHAAGGIVIGANVGVGPHVRILTSQHTEGGRATPILSSALAFAPVMIEDDADIGVGTVILPGVTIGRGAQVGAGAVVADDLPPYCVAAGVPARVLRMRPEAPPVGDEVTPSETK